MPADRIQHYTRSAYLHGESQTMKLKDLPVIGITGLLTFFFAYPETRNIYEMAYKANPLLLTFVKFAILATAGEMIALRLKVGVYHKKDFGLLPKMIIWGILGLFIYFAFGIFSKGVPTLFPGLVGDHFMNRLLIALLISIFMNVIFAPGMMLTHHITDSFISQNGGSFKISKFKVRPLLNSINWDKMWSFVFMKTIPFFWIPAHTITFLLPAEFRTIFAAALSVLLGIFLGARSNR
ncbi:MAG: hypothetical protein OCD02_00825 [Spirochaetaceae bacterium]